MGKGKDKSKKSALRECRVEGNMERAHWGSREANVELVRTPSNRYVTSFIEQTAPLDKFRTLEEHAHVRRGEGVEPVQLVLIGFHSPGLNHLD